MCTTPPTDNANRFDALVMVLICACGLDISLKLFLSLFY